MNCATVSIKEAYFMLFHVFQYHRNFSFVSVWVPCIYVKLSKRQTLMLEDRRVGGVGTCTWKGTEVSIDWQIFLICSIFRVSKFNIWNYSLKVYFFPFPDKPNKPIKWCLYFVLICKSNLHIKGIHTCQVWIWYFCNLLLASCICDI